MNPRTFLRGETRVLDLTVVDANGDATNLTGAVIEFELKALPGGADPALIICTTTSGAIVLADQGVAATLGHATLTIPSTAWALVTAGAYYYDVVLVLAGVRTYVIPPTQCQVLDVVNQP